MTQLQPLTVIGQRYQLKDIVGEGGMATVWRAVALGAETFARPVAVKVMKRAFSTAQPHLAMFLEEARIGAELQHAHLVQVLDFFAEERGSYCLVMEWIEGMDLRTLTHAFARLERPLPWTFVVQVGIGVLRGLAAAHERRARDGSAAPVIHRDVSPQNILLGLNGGIKLGDFGMARARDRGSSKQLTAPGVVKGTVSYMAPEILRGKAAVPESDLYSLACTMWESLAGERLYDAPSDAEVVVMIRRGQAKPLDEVRPDVPPRLVAAVHRALSIEPSARFASARAMIQELGEVLKESAPWIDSDVLVGTTVGQAREAQAR
jgi:serine/threonine-protein kinase